MDSDNWTIVGKPTKKKVTLCVTKEKVDISLETIIERIRHSLDYLKQYIVAVYIYGSRARKTNKLTSDVDLIIFWKNMVDKEDLKEIKQQLEKDIQLPVDFVSCVHKKKWVDTCDERDKCYYDLIVQDAVQVMGTEQISYLLETSVKLGKV